MEPARDIARRLQDLQERLALAARRSGRSPGAVTLVGISKRKSAELVVAAVRAGLRDVGESYVQEAVAKLPRVLAQLEAAGTPPPRRHFVGRLQRNKARDAVRWFDVIQSVDRAALAQEIGRRAEAAGRDLDVLLQVNLAGELQKAGAPPEALPELLGVCAAQRRLRVVGLMTLPPASPDPEQSRPFFARLRALSDDLRRSEAGADLVQLSMGMSADFEVAIEEGATLVRVGTALFGPREV